MRPCRHCRSPIENNVTTCPQCGTVQDERAQPTGPVPPPALRRRLFRRTPAAAHANTDSLSWLGFIMELFGLLGHAGVFLPFLVVLGAIVGCVLAGGHGAIVGAGAAVATIFTVFAVLSLFESSEG